MSSDKPRRRRVSRAPRRVPSQRPGPVGGKRDQNRRQRTEDLLSAGLALFLERGIETVTVDEIARVAGTAKGNFYRYLEGKRDLVEALLAPVERLVFDAMDRCEAEIDAAESVEALNGAFTSLAMSLLQVYIAHQDIVRLYLQEGRVPGGEARAPLTAFEQRLTERTVALTVIAHEHGLLGKIPPAVSALGVIGAVERLLLAHLRGQIAENEAQIATSLVRMVMEGIAG